MAKRIKSSAAVAELDVRAHAHEAAIRGQLDARGGVTGPIMRKLIDLFQYYRHTPRLEEISDALIVIEELKLFSLPEHKFGVGGALCAVMDLHPNEAEIWKKYHKHVLTAAERTAAHLPSGDVTRPEEIEFLWMWWMVTGEDSVLERIGGLAGRSDLVGQHALAYLMAHRQLVEVSDLLRSMSAKGTTVAGVPVSFAVTVANCVPQQDAVRRLSLHVLGLPGGRYRVVLVGWVNATEHLHASFVIVTPDGLPVDGCPELWEDHPVRYLRVTQEQLAKHSQLLNAAEEV